MYADLNYYTMLYYKTSESSLIPKEYLEMYLKRASVVLNHLFAGRKPNEPYDEKLKCACCEIADCLYRMDKREGIKAESNDGYSVTFDTAPSVFGAAYEIAVKYLGLGGLLYRGIDE